MKIIKVGYKENAIIELKADDLTTICNALYDYQKTNDRQDELLKQIKGIRAVLRTANNICQYGNPLVEQTVALINK